MPDTYSAEYLNLPTLTGTEQAETVLPNQLFAMHKAEWGMMRKILLPITCLTVATVFAAGLPKEVKLSIEGDAVTVSIYKLDEPLIIKPLYEPRDDLDAYAWFKPLLFTLNTYALSVPKEQWPQYGEGDWPEERYDGIEKAMSRLKTTCMENPDTWGNQAMFNELSAVALCKVDGNG